MVLAAGVFARDVPFRSAQDPRLDASVDATTKPSATGKFADFGKPIRGRASS